MKWLSELNDAYEAAVAHKELPHVAAQLEKGFVGLEIPLQILNSSKANGFSGLAKDVDDAASSFFSLTTTLPCELTNGQYRQKIRSARMTTAGCLRKG